MINGVGSNGTLEPFKISKRIHLMPSPNAIVCLFLGSGTLSATVRRTHGDELVHLAGGHRFNF